MPPTPGPWINDNGLVNGQETRARFAPGVSVDLFDANEYPEELRDEMLSNAALIAAAPVMRSLLQRWIALDGGAWHIERHALEKTRLISDTRAAIATADAPTNG